MQPQQLPSTDQTAPSPAPFQLPDSVGQPATTQTPVSKSGTPDIADDGDLIEKDWVAKVKQIIGNTAHDPYEQSKQLTELKADYLQKRYGKVIKAEE